MFNYKKYYFFHLRTNKEVKSHLTSRIYFSTFTNIAGVFSCQCSYIKNFPRTHVNKGQDPLKRAPTSGGVVTLKTGRQEVPGSYTGLACRPSRQEFFVVFFETRVNIGQDHLERPSRRAFHPQAQFPRETVGFKSYNQLKIK